MGRSPYRHLGSDLCSSRTGARGQALVISAFPVNRIIIAHSIERINRTPISVDPSAGVNALPHPHSRLVVLDATGEPQERVTAYARLEELRERHSRPRNRPNAPERRSDADGDPTVTFAADDVNHKPFTP